MRDEHRDPYERQRRVYKNCYALITGVVSCSVGYALTAQPAKAHGILEEPAPWLPRRHHRHMKAAREVPNFEVRNKC